MTKKIIKTKDTLGRVLRLRKRISDCLREKFRGQVLVHEVFIDMLHEIGEILGITNDQQEYALRVTAREWAGKMCNRDVEYDLSTTVAGISGAILRGSIQPEAFSGNIWIPYEIHDIQIGTARFQNVSYVADIVALTYPIAGRHLSFVIRNLDAFASDLGFPRRAEVMFRDLFGMQFDGLTRQDEDKIRIANVRVTLAEKRRNNRLRIDRGKDCILGIAGLECNRCPRGLDQCQRATHWYTFDRRACKNGHIGWFDPAHKSPICIDCQLKLVFG